MSINTDYITPKSGSLVNITPGSSNIFTTHIMNADSVSTSLLAGTSLTATAMVISANMTFGEATVSDASITSVEISTGSFPSLTTLGSSYTVTDVDTQVLNMLTLSPELNPDTLHGIRPSLIFRTSVTYSAFSFGGYPGLSVVGSDGTPTTFYPQCLSCPSEEDVAADGSSAGTMFYGGVATVKSVHAGDSITMHNLDDKTKECTLAVNSAGVCTITPTLRTLISSSAIPEYDNNTTAKAAGLANGRVYRTADELKIVHS